MDDTTAQFVVDYWSGGGGLVPRGPKIVLGTKPATPSDVERHTGRRPSPTGAIWRVEVGGRFLRSGGLVYPGGVPYPEDLARRTAVIANEVWLYVDDDGDVLGEYWWPDAVRRPIASVPRDEYAPEQIVSPAEAAVRFAGDVRVPCTAPWTPAVAVMLSDGEAIFFLTQGEMPDPLHEMLVFEHRGLSVRAEVCPRSPNVDDFVRDHSPPYRRLHSPGSGAVGRDPGRSLGPQTWPWPGELRWWEDGVSYELKGFVPLSTLQDVAAGNER